MTLMDLELIIMVMEYYGNNIEMKRFVKFSLTVMLMVLGLVILLFTCPKYPFMKIVELGDNFALLQQDDTDIVYDRNGDKECFSSSESVQVVPFEVVAYNFNDRWIIAKSDSKAGDNPQYWIIDKKYNFSRLGYREELQRQTTGPLDSISFYKTIKTYGIDLQLKYLSNK